MSRNCHVRGWTCGTAHAYNRHHCRCDPCTAAKMRYRARFHGQTPPTHGRWAYVAYQCRCRICSEGHNAYQRERRLRRGAIPRNTRISEARAAIAVGKALQSMLQPPSLADLRLLARHEHRPVYLVGCKATLRRPFAGPFLEVLPSGAVSHVGPGGDNRRPTQRRGPA